MDDDKGLPKTSVSGLVKELMGKNSKYSNLFVEHVHEIANEFITKVADEANKKCQSKGKMKISIDDVLGSLGELGMKEYLESLKTEHETFLKEANDKNKFKHKISNEQEQNRLREKQKKDLDQMALEYASAQEMIPKPKDNSEINYLEVNDDEDYENFDD